MADLKKKVHEFSYSTEVRFLARMKGSHVYIYTPLLGHEKGGNTGSIVLAKIRKCTVFEDPWCYLHLSMHIRC